MKNKLSKNINNLEESGIRKLFNAHAGKKGLINLSIGQAHFDTPIELKTAAKNAIDNNFNGYTPTLGLPALREKIAKKLNKKNNIKAKTDDVIITSGVSGALFLAFGAILDKNDEIILPDPYFVLYKQVLSFLGVKIKYLDTYPDFQVNPEKLEKLITKKTKAILLNSPNNPTGAVYDEKSLRQIALIAKKHNLIIISDEIYEDFDYDKKFFSIGSIYKNTITVNGHSKTYSIAGWRLGYAHGPSEIIEAMSRLQQYTFVCSPSVAQVALNEKFDINLESEYKNYKTKRDLVYNSLKDKFEIIKSDGAFYFFIKIPNIKNFVQKCLNKNLLIVPGEAFSKKKGYFRISFAASDKDLKKGLDALNKIV